MKTASATAGTGQDTGRAGVGTDKWLKDCLHIGDDRVVDNDTFFAKGGTFDGQSEDGEEAGPVDFLMSSERRIIR